MLWIITKFILCMLAAGVFGFIFGWIFSSLVRNEKQEQKYALLQDEFNNHKAQMNQTYSDLEAKEKELEHLHKLYQQSQKELMMKNLDLEECEKGSLSSSDNEQLLIENNSLKEEIAEYRYLKNENALLQEELKDFEKEKEKLISRLEIADQLTHTNHYLDSNTEPLSTQQSKQIKKHLKRAKKELRKIHKTIQNPTLKKKKSEENGDALK